MNSSFSARRLGRAPARLWKQEPVLCLSALAAAAGICSRRPSLAACLAMVDGRVLALLFALMAVVAGFESCGVLGWLAQKLLRQTRSPRSLCLALVLLPFFTSALITNDVSLLAFVPFAFTSLALAGRRDLTISVVTLQTLAANLGSMSTPVGNPQNLYLYNKFSLSAADFFTTTLPFTLISLLALTAACLLLGRRGAGFARPQGEAPLRLAHRGRLALSAALFCLALLAVLRLVSPFAAAAAVALAFGLGCPSLFKKVDWALLATFVCFFLFAGCLRLPAASAFLNGLLQKNALLAALLASQVLSNVPAALLLSGFTQNWRALLLGVDLGGLGTPVASLASLISLGLYRKSAGARPGRYLLFFTLANLAGLALLLPLALA